MRVFLFATLFLNAVLAQAQTNTTTTISTKASSFKDLGLRLEFGSASVRDDSSEIVGSSSSILIEPKLKINSQFTAYIGTNYFFRNAGGTLEGAEQANRDHLSDVYAKVLWNISKYRDNGIGDFRLQARVYSDQDDFFKRRYASDGNYQIRAYFGRPLIGKFHLSKYTNYLRYKNYFNNKHVNDFTRDYELRAKVTPTYTPTRGLDFGLTAEYNHYFKVNKTDDEQAIDISASARYQKGNYAALITAETPYMKASNGDALEITEDAGRNIEYGVFLSVSL